MEDTREIEEDPPHRGWVSTWLRDEMFWRDVASRSLSGVIVVLVGGIAATSIAWGIDEDVRAYLLQFGMFFLSFVVGAIACLTWAVKTDRWAEEPESAIFAWRTLVQIVVGLLILVAPIAFAIYVNGWWG